jgi:hypothetical protein
MKMAKKQLSAKEHLEKYGHIFPEAGHKFISLPDFKLVIHKSDTISQHGAFSVYDKNGNMLKILKLSVLPCGCVDLVVDGEIE